MSAKITRLPPRTSRSVDQTISAYQGLEPRICDIVCLAVIINNLTVEMGSEEDETNSILTSIKSNSNVLVFAIYQLVEMIDQLAIDFYVAGGDRDVA